MSTRKPPTHFIAIRITDEDIRKAGIQFHSKVLEDDRIYRDCIIPVGDLHLTLGVCRWSTCLEVVGAFKVLRKLKPELSVIIQKTKRPILVSGIGNFNYSKVIYAKCECAPSFVEMVHHLDHCFKQEGLDIQMNDVHHMTLMKITRQYINATGKESVDSMVYERLQDIVFGEQVIDNIHLCEISTKRQADGFYISPQTIEL